MSFKIIIILLFILCRNNLFSQEAEDIITDRPDQTESAFTVSKGHMQFEIGGFIEKNNSEGGLNEQTISVPSALFRFGLTEKVELRFGFQYNTSRLKFNNFLIEKNSGLSPVYLGTKIKMFEEENLIPETAFILGTFVPFESSIYQPKYVSGLFRFTMSNTLNDRLTLSYNLGGAWDGERPNATGLYTLALGISLTEKLSMYLESYGFYTQSDAPNNLADGGFAFLILPNLQADISAGAGLDKVSPDYFLGIGLSGRFPE